MTKAEEKEKKDLAGEFNASDRGMVEKIIINLKRVESDYKIDLTKEMEWLRGVDKRHLVLTIEDISVIHKLIKETQVKYTTTTGCYEEVLKKYLESKV